jgi:hypothetical protein
MDGDPSLEVIDSIQKNALGFIFKICHRRGDGDLVPWQALPGCRMETREEK